MSDLWHDCISDELEMVEDLMAKELMSENQELTEMCRYVMTSGGKRIRPAVCILAYYACGGRDPQRAIEIGSAFEIIHSATLVHDDINDQGELRRGRKSLYREYTIGKAIITGDFMFAMGFRLIGSTFPGIVEYIVDASASMSAGEFTQKKFEHKSKVTEADYMEIINGKTAKIISASAKAGALISDADIDTLDAIGDYALALGIAFQIIDDTLDVIGDADSTGKLVGIDLIEGKPTLPIIYAMEDLRYGKQIVEVFETEEPDAETVEKAIGMIKKTDAIRRCREKAMEVLNEARHNLDVIGDSIYKRALLALGDYVVTRDK
ncbi:MAG: polyprenyl synthetase family protein [Candidatus Methanomethylophilaceae archaeon]